MSKLKGLKKTLAVFMAALMVMSCWVFTPISFEAEAGTDNSSLLDGLSESLNTDVTTVYGSFESDYDNLSDTDYNNVYHNVLYTDGTVSSATATSIKTQYGSNTFGSNGVTVYWYHPQATLMYDGDKDNLPRLGVAIGTQAYKNGDWSITNVHRLSWLSSDGKGFAFTQNWKGSDTRLNFQYMWNNNSVSEAMGYTSEVTNKKMRKTHEDSNYHYFANTLKFTGTMSDSDYYIDITPTFSFLGDNKNQDDTTSSAKTISATSTKSIAIINYVPLRTALTAALKVYEQAAANPNYYTTESVTKFVELSKALVAAKPNNYVNSSKNDYTGYAAAAKAAVDAWNAWKGLEVRQITFTLKADGGTFMTTGSDTYTITKTYKEKLDSIVEPIRKGYTFNGFYSSNGVVQLTTDTLFEDDLTWTAKWTINSYRASFQYKEKEAGKIVTYTANTYVNYGSRVDIPKDSMLNYSESAFTIGDYKYKLTGWTLDGKAVTFPTTMPAKNPTYVATYSEEFLKADLTDLKAQIARADEAKKTDYYKNGGYVDTSSLDNAYTLAAGLNKDTTPLSQQEQVKNATEALKSAIDNLKVKEITITFMDKTGAILKDGYHYVKWGTNVTIPSDPSIDNDLSYHYKFKGWQDADGNEKTSDELTELCKGVKADATYYAIFEAVEHTWKDETISSTCTSDGAIKHTCTSCGYTYESDTDDKAHHTWTTDKVVVKAATCSSEGIKAIQCTECKVYKEGSIESIPTTDHDFGEYTTEVERTCQGKGIKYRECSNCEAREYIYEDKLDHDFDRTTINATCTTGGYTKQVCSRCNLIKISAETPAKDHNLNTVTTLEPTCMSVGYKTTTCSNKNCDYEKIEIIPALTSHSYPDTWTTVEAATCGHQGIEKRECSVCRMTEYQVTPKLAEHNWDSGVETVKATCTRDGLKTYTCGTCGATKTETIDSPGGHNLVNDPDNSQAATCTSPEIVAQKCSNADCDYTTKEVGAALGHDLEATTTVAATCNNAGYKVLKCNNTGCDYGYTEYTDAATGEHDWEFTTSQSGTQLTVKGKCSSCEAETETTVPVAEGHTYSSVSVKKQPTCKETGTIVIACDKKHNADCTATIEATLPTNPDAHKNITTAYTQADCTNDGKVVTTCSDCDAKIAETKITAKGHSYTTKVSETLATCKTAGSVTLKCANCDDTKTINTDINPNAHKYEKTSSVNATCTTSAYDVYTCENGCGETYNRYTGNALGHDWGEAVVQQNGNLITVTRTCKRADCGETETVLTNNAIDYRHDYSGKVETVTAATCKAEGKIRVYCKDEGCDSYVEINIGTNANAHTLETKYKAPDCLNDGYVKTYCTECTNVLSNQKIDKLGHDFFTNLETTVATTPATCTTDGTKSVKCARCDATTNVTIPKLGHSYKKVSGGKAATCTEYGWDKYECENCGATYNELIKESGHKLTGEPQTIAPTCTEQGYTKQYCEACGELIKSDYVNASGHNFDGEGTVVTPPTCTAGGYTTYTCQNEGCTYGYVGDYTPTSSHDYTGENSIVVTPPTCTSKGYTTHQCKNCEYYFIDTYVDATGHDFDKTKGEAGTDAETGKNYTRYPCKHECGEYQYEYVGDGCTHANWEYVKTVAPTCIKDGYDIYSCPTCKDNEIKTNIKPALGHNWDYWEIENYPYADADGTQHNGIQKHVCLRCGIEETQEIIEGKFYLVTFYNYDGTRLIRPAYYPYGTEARTPDFTPVRVADNGYTYTFKGYNYSQDEISCVTKRMAIIAEYEATEREYSVTYMNGNGTILQTSGNVKYNSISESYIGAVPTKASDEYYNYTFSSWTIQCDSETGTAVATATFDQRLKDPDKTPTSNQPGLLTKFVEWLKNLFKKLFGIK